METKKLKFEDYKKQILTDLKASKTKKSFKRTIDFYFKNHDFWKEEKCEKCDEKKGIKCDKHFINK